MLGLSLQALKAEFYGLGLGLEDKSLGLEDKCLGNFIQGR